MKEIRAYIQPFVLGRLVQTLTAIPDFPGLTVSDCEGFGRDKIEAGSGFTPFAAKKRLEIFAPDDLVEPIVAAIMAEAHTGRPGDGKVFVVEILEGGKIRTGERGPGVV